MRTLPRPKPSRAAGPPVRDPCAVTTADARALSRVLFARLHGTAPGSAEHLRLRNALVELNLPLVRFAARRFRHNAEPAEDIVQAGTIGLIKAIDRFDPRRDVEFATFALPTITGEIKRFFRDTSWSVRVPRRLQELRLDLAGATEELRQLLVREPTVPELAARLSISEAEVVQGQLASNAYTAGSLEAPADAPDDPEGPLARRLGYQDDALESVPDLVSLRPLIARLTERDRRILALRFVGELSQAQIGALLGISQMHVSRLLNRALTQLRTGLLAEPDG
jgi:RNA polymerase sigma-B factor